MAYAFLFDASSCSGCKACQVACKDKNNLPLGVLWRRVYEVSGGDWAQAGEAWTNTVLAYNFSITCNHCIHPKCAGVCPGDAFKVRTDGIVLIDPKKCLGCGYCAWACPYDAPQADRFTGIMTKCNLCHDNLDAGLPVACVAACPMRSLELVQVNDPNIEDKGLALWKIPGDEHPFPLPKLSRTEPHLVVKPHPGMNQRGMAAHLNNREETSPGLPLAAARREIPLVFFTLFAQMAIGLFAAIFLIDLLLENKLFALRITTLPLLVSGTTIMVSLSGSLFHLGNPGNAWRALSHLRKSWLSREIFFISGFAGFCLMLSLVRFFVIVSFEVWISMAGFTAICGLMGLFCMQRVYQLRNVPGWNTTRTPIEFSISTLGLGSLLTGTLLPEDSPSRIMTWIFVAGLSAFLAAGIFTLSMPKSENLRLRKSRVWLIMAGVIGTLILLFLPSNSTHGLLFFVFGLALAEETLGRWLFYCRRKPGIWNEMLGRIRINGKINNRKMKS